MVHIIYVEYTFMYKLTLSQVMFIFLSKITQIIYVVDT